MKLRHGILLFFLILASPITHAQSSCDDIFAASWKTNLPVRFQNYFEQSWEPHLQGTLFFYLNDEIPIIQKDQTESEKKMKVLARLGFEKRDGAVKTPTMTQFIQNYLGVLKEDGIPVDETFLPAVFLFQAGGLMASRSGYKYITPGVDPWPDSPNYFYSGTMGDFTVPSAVVIEAQKHNRYPFLPGIHDLFHFVSFIIHPHYARAIIKALRASQNPTVNFKLRLNYANEYLSLPDPTQKPVILLSLFTPGASDPTRVLQFADFKNYYATQNPNQLLGEANHLAKILPGFLMDLGGGVARTNEKNISLTNLSASEKANFFSGEKRELITQFTPFLELPSAWKLLTEYLIESNSENQAQNLRVHLARTEYFFWRCLRDMPMERMIAGLLADDPQTFDPELVQFVDDVFGENSLFYSLFQNTNFGYFE